MYMNKKKTKITLWIALGILLVVLIVWIHWGNTALELTTYTIRSSRLPGSFDGYRIAQVSDLHNAEMGEDNENLLQLLRDTAPDLIAITGDLIDSRRTNMEISLDFVREAEKIAPCYYVTGNHESRIEEYPDFKAALEAAGVTVLEDAQLELSLDGERITLMGVRDPSFQVEEKDEEAAYMDAVLTQLCENGEGYRILLSHRPELFETYASHDIDLILSGHAHGGQFRLPWLGGVLVPGQGFFPKYEEGLHTQANTNLVISRGIGNSVVPIRINNRPEVVLIELRKQ